ncbi:DUF6452 family protein [Taibaiella soli]|nr:DUF6452 family protein [Taibaiella soli]
MTKKDRSLFTGVIMLLLTLGLVACETQRDPCLTPTTVYVRAGAYRFADTGTAVLDTFLLNPILGPADSPQKGYSAGQNVNKFYNEITLNPTVDSCSWYFVPDSAYLDRRDTITFYYYRQLKFISNACGYTYYYSINNVKSTRHGFADNIHAIDSVVLSSGTINGNANIENLKIYIHKNS